MYNEFAYDVPKKSQLSFHVFCLEKLVNYM